MVIVRILQRKDAASLVVAVAAAIVVAQFLTFMGNQLSYELLGAGPGEDYTPDWKVTYAVPIVALLLQLVMLEVLARLVVWGRSMAINRR